VPFPPSFLQLWVIADCVCAFCSVMSFVGHEYKKERSEMAGQVVGNDVEGVLEEVSGGEWSEGN